MIRRIAFVTIAAAACSGGDATQRGSDPDGGAAPAIDAATGASDASASDAAAESAADAASRDASIDAAIDAPKSNWVPSIVGVGYGGLRVVSRDNGLTWKNKVELASGGGDDQDLLRGIAYGNGRWVTVGWRVFTSADGAVTWQEQTPAQGCGLMEGVAFGAGHFIGSCGTDAYESTDSVTWTHVATVGDTGGHTYLFFQGGKFYSSGDSMRSYSSPDGHTWTELVGTRAVAFCNGALATRATCPGFWNAGMFLGSEWQSKITRSTDGTHFSIVFDDPGNNAPYTPYAFAMGMSPP